MKHCFIYKIFLYFRDEIDYFWSRFIASCLLFVLFNKIIHKENE